MRTDGASLIVSEDLTGSPALPVDIATDSGLADDAVGTADGGAVRAVVEDMLEPLYEEIRKLRWLMHHDVLTGLPNELSFQRRLKEVDGGCFLVVDLDGFKDYQDRLQSHRAGDQVICEFASHLLSALKELAPGRSPLCARLHGDEFILWVEHRDAAEALRDYLEQWENQYGGVTASVGVGSTLDSADLEMYQRKARRKQRRFQARLSQP